MTLLRSYFSFCAKEKMSVYKCDFSSYSEKAYWLALTLQCKHTSLNEHGNWDHCHQYVSNDATKKVRMEPEKHLE